MRIRDLVGGVAPVFSFEFFPPKTERGEKNLYASIEKLRDLRPAFVSVTYGAGGSTRDKTVEWAAWIKREIGIEAMAHLTCVGARRDEVARLLERLWENRIENLLLLRGDPPKEPEVSGELPNDFRFAADLVTFVRTQPFPFCLGGAGYPEGHVECRDLEIDMLHLKHKVDCGLDFVITQLFFDNADYYAFVARARRHGIRVPILAGIMPITNVAQIHRFTAMCGARIPDDLRARLDAAPDDHAVRTVGIEHATQQCVDLLAHGTPGIHFYTLNQSTATRAVLERLRGG